MEQFTFNIALVALIFVTCTEVAAICYVLVAITDLSIRLEQLFEKVKEELFKLGSEKVENDTESPPNRRQQETEDAK